MRGRPSASGRNLVGMGNPAERKYSPAQRRAIFELKDAGNSARQVAEQLATQGYGDVAPFEIPASSVYDVAKSVASEEAGIRITALARRPAAEATAELVTRMIVIADDQTRAMARDAKKGQLDGLAFERMARGLSHLDSAARKVSAGQGAGGGRRPPSDPKRPVDPDSLEAELLREAAEPADPENPTPHKRPTDLATTATRPGPAADEPARQLNGQTAGSALSL